MQGGRVAQADLVVTIAVSSCVMLVTGQWAGGYCEPEQSS